MKADTPQRYAPFTRFLHWGMAACYAFMFASALAWHLNGSLKFLIAPHKAVGVLLLLLAAVRFVWALRNLRRRLGKCFGIGATLLLISWRPAIF